MYKSFLLIIALLLVTVFTYGDRLLKEEIGEIDFSYDYVWEIYMKGVEETEEQTVLNSSCEDGYIVIKVVKDVGEKSVVGVFLKRTTASDGIFEAVIITERTYDIYGSKLKEDIEYWVVTGRIP